MKKPEPSVTVSGRLAGTRLDLFMVEAFPGMSRKKAKKLVDGRLVSVNGAIEHMASRELKTGDRISFREAEAVQKSEHPPSSLAVLFDRAGVLSVDKPWGLVSGSTLDPGRASAEKIAKKQFGGPLTLLHRLDRDTSGVLLFARDRATSASMLEAFKKRAIAKTYLAVVSGTARPDFHDLCHLKEAGNSRVVVVKSGGMRAETYFKTLDAAGGYSLVEARPVTGRMHQIRAQLARLGHPIAGDALYGGAASVEKGGKSFPVKRQLLHALKVEFVHPSTGEKVGIESPVPEDFSGVTRFLFGK